MLLLLASCSADTTLDQADSSAQDEPTVAPGPTQDEVTPDSPDLDEDAAESAPVPYIPAGRPGSAADYDELISRLEQEVPAELRNEVPWPDLRNPDPTRVQIEIFDLWIWMTANLPEPKLVEVMTVPGSPSREDVVAVFGRLDRNNQLEIRTAQPYQAFDHVVVTFESAGLPLWLGRDVPDDAVVVYYSDNSGPVDVIDRDTREFITRFPPTSTRSWLSIMVPTDVGWQIWRDQLLDASNGLEVPDVPPPPGRNDQDRTPEL